MKRRSAKDVTEDLLNNPLLLFLYDKPAYSEPVKWKEVQAAEWQQCRAIVNAAFADTRDA